VEITQPAFGIRIKSLRREHGLGQSDLAARVGISIEEISNIERGVNWVSKKTWKCLAKAFDVPETALVDYSGNEAFIASGGLKWRAPRKHSGLIVRHKRVEVRIPK
jgi:transcriptional regulator with XRE-family HTH domain